MDFNTTTVIWAVTRNGELRIGIGRVGRGNIACPWIVNKRITFLFAVERNGTQVAFRDEEIWSGMNLLGKMEIGLTP